MTDEIIPAEPSIDDSGIVTEELPEESSGEGGAEAEEEIKKLKQAVEITDIGPCKKHIKVTVDREDVDELLDEKYSELVVDANVPGFRPGKVPRKIIERRFHKEVSDQVKAEVLLTSLEQLAEDFNLAPLSPPNLDPGAIEIPKEGPMFYEFDVEVRPDFELPNYKGLHLTRPVREFTDEDVAVEERRVLSPDGTLVPKESGNAQMGDVLISDVTTRYEDRLLSTFNEFMTRVDARLAFRDGVAERFIEEVRGVKPGQTRNVSITLSNSVADASLRGKTVTATFEVKEVKEVRLPELSETYLEKFGVRTPEQFHELVRVQLQRRLDYIQRQKAREQVMEKLAGTIQWELPEELLVRQARRAINRKIMEMRAEGITEQEILGRQRLLQQDTLRSTAQALKEHFVLQKIAEVEDIDVDEDDLEAEIERYAERTGESPRRVRAKFEKEDLMDALAAEIVERKALDLVLDTAEYTDVPLEEGEQKSLGTIEQQTVPGEMKDPVDAPPPEPEAKDSSTTTESAPAVPT